MKERLARLRRRLPLHFSGDVARADVRGVVLDLSRVQLERHHANIIVASSPGEAVDMARAPRALNPEWDAPLSVPSGSPAAVAPARRPSKQPDSLR